MLRGAGLQPLFLHPLSPSSPRGSVPGGAVPVPAVGHGVERLLGHLRRGHLHSRLQPEPLLPPGDAEEALHGQTLPGPASGTPCGKQGPWCSRDLWATALTGNGGVPASTSHGTPEYPCTPHCPSPATSQIYSRARQTTRWWRAHSGDIRQLSGSRSSPEFGGSGCLNLRALWVPCGSAPCSRAGPVPAAEAVPAAPAWLPGYTEAGLFHPFN